MITGQMQHTVKAYKQPDPPQHNLTRPVWRAEPAAPAVAQPTTPGQAAEAAPPPPDPGQSGGPQPRSAAAAAQQQPTTETQRPVARLCRLPSSDCISESDHQLLPFSCQVTSRSSVGHSDSETALQPKSLSSDPWSPKDTKQCGARPCIQSHQLTHIVSP